MALFNVKSHVILFFSLVVFLLVEQSISDHDNVPSRLLGDSTLPMSRKINLSQGEDKEVEEDEVGKPDSTLAAKEKEKEGELIKEEEEEKDENKKNKRKKEKEKEGELIEEEEKEKEKDEHKKKKKKEEGEEATYEELDTNGKKKKKKDEEEATYEEFDGNGKKKEGKHTAVYEEFDANGKKKKKDDEEKKTKKNKKDEEEATYDESDANGKKKEEGPHTAVYEEFDANGKKKKKDDEEKKTKKNKKDEESPTSLTCMKSLLSLSDSSLDKNREIPPTLSEGCKKADFPPECEAAVISVAKDTETFDASSMFEYSALALSKALNIAKKFALDPNSGVDTEIGSVCKEVYKDSCDALKGAMKAFEEKDRYMAKLKLSAVITDMDTCENAIGKDSPSKLAQANIVLSKLSANTICMGDAALNFSDS